MMSAVQGAIQQRREAQLAFWEAQEDLALPRWTTCGGIGFSWARSCLNMLMIQHNIFVANRVAMGATDTKLPRF